MKKHLFLSLLVAGSFAGTVFAQSLTPVYQGIYDSKNEIYRDISFVPKIFTAAGQSQCWECVEENGNTSLFLLDEDFRPAGKTISFNSGEALQLYTLYEERKYVDTPEGGGYTGEWTERKESNGNIYRSKRFLSIEGFYDMDDGHEMESGFDLTQNLFNTDDKYEYLCAYYELVKGSTQEHDRDGDGMIDERITYYHTEISKIACESEGGKILWQIDAIDSYAYIYKWHGKYYLYTESALYLIDKESTGLKTAQNTGSMKVYPTLARQSDAITIELNAAGGNTLRHLYISDAAGRIVDSRTVEAGKNNVSVDGGRFRSGMYNFTLEENGRIVDNGKIIVR